ncbi:MAG: hypothetical protein LT080_09505 [Thiobacillus sp.]|nr:hypothetical protein [Thiobacillus sp.]
MAGEKILCMYAFPPFSLCMPVPFMKDIFILGAVPDDLAPSDRRKWCLIPGIAVKVTGWAHAVVRPGIIHPGYFVMLEIGHRPSAACRNYMSMSGKH